MAAVQERIDPVQAYYDRLKAMAPSDEMLAKIDEMERADRAKLAAHHEDQPAGRHRR